MTNEFLTNPQGWQCPICKRIYSPMILMCYYCGAEQKTITCTATVEDIDKDKMKSFAKQIGEYHD